jgi:glycosyltransferase involved in cell wall biosynthesis
LSVGYPFEPKGVGELVQAFRKLATDHPDLELRIMRSPEDILRAVPGLVIAQHQGGVVLGSHGLPSMVITRSADAWFQPGISGLFD